MLESTVHAFFTSYERAFNDGLAGTANLDDVAALYASEFIAAGPMGVMAGRNDDSLKAAMSQGYERYRAMGTRAMQLRDVRLSPIDALHVVAHVAWTAVYARAGRADVAIDFEVHYLLQEREGVLRVFGWVSGDEQALMREHGLLD